MSYFVQTTIAADVSELPHALAFVTSFASHGIQDVWKIELAVEEAIVNIVEHGYQYHPGSIDIECETTPTDFIIRLQDTAFPFNPTTYIPVHENACSVRGRGISLMRAVTDAIEYTRSDTTNTLTLRKQR